MKSKTPTQALDEWQSLYETVPPLLAEGEKIISMVAKELDVDNRTAKGYIDQWVKEGKLVEVGWRRNRGSKDVMAYRVVKP